MRQKGITKIPGCSWIQMDSQLDEFCASDSSHPIADEICHALDCLFEEMAREGYVPNANTVQKVEDEDILFFYSYQVRLVRNIVQRLFFFRSLVSLRHSIEYVNIEVMIRTLELYH